MTAARPLSSAIVISGPILSAILAVSATAQERPSKYTLELTTETTALPFALPAIPGMPAIPGLPTEAAKRVLAGEALYPNRAVEPIFVAVPADLGLADNRLILHVPKPSPEEVEEAPPDEEAPQEPPPPMEFTLKLYWHPDTAEGPITEVVSFKPGETDMPAPPPGGLPGIGGMLTEELEKVARGSAEEFPEKALGAGNYTLNTGNLTMPLAGFLPALKVIEPKSLAEAEPEKGIALRWEPVAGAKGFIVHATGTVFENDRLSAVINWVSTLREPPERVRHDYEQETTIADDVANGILLPPTTTSCKIPPGIFVGVDMLTVTVTAVGADYYDQLEGAILRGKIRSSWTAMKMARLNFDLPAPDEED